MSSPTSAQVCFLILAIPSLAASEPPNAPEANRKLVAEVVQVALAPELAKAKVEVPATEERHREEKEITIEIGPIKEKKTVVVFWRSEVSGSATFLEPDKKLVVEVPKMVRDKDTRTITMTASAPVSGSFAGKVMTDNPKVKVAELPDSPFTCTLAVTAEGTVTRVEEMGAVNYKVTITKWTPELRELKFKNDLLDKLNGPIRKLADDKLKAEAEKLREKANAALLQAYKSGKLKLSD